MTTNADIGSGATFSIGDGASPEVFSAVGEVVSIGLPEETTETADATHLGSGTHREYIPGLSDGGEIAIEFNYTDTGYAAIKAKRTAGGVFNVECAEPGGAEWAAAVICTALKAPELTADGIMRGSATFKVTGAPTFTAA